MKKGMGMVRQLTAIALVALFGLAAFPSLAMAQGSISGTVTDADTGDAIQAAFVTANTPGVFSWNVDFTDADGAFLIEDVDAGTYEVAVNRFGYARQIMTVEVVDGETAVADFALEPPSFGTVSGTVTDADTGEAIEDAWVLVRARFRWRFASTDADGAYTVENVLAGDRTVSVFAWGYFGDSADVEVIGDETTTADFALTGLTFGSVEGTVTDAGTGDALEGARVSSGWWNSAFTDVDGAYLLEDLVAGERTVRTSAFGYFNDVSTVEVVGSETATLDVALDALAFGDISGTVTDSGTGDPIEGARVSTGWWWNSTFTDVDGNYTLEDLLVGDYNVFVTAMGYTAASVEATVTDGATTTADVALDGLAFGSVSGIVTDAVTGDPVEGAFVSTGFGFFGGATTDADGAYLLEDVVVGDATVRVFGFGYLFNTSTVTVEEGETAVNDVELTPW